ncbi:hypothetical protein CDD82_4795 [Ophiocordyceps australis]|uniref:Uncharacterized protein n=1 Tax=Ophiocordyceps australis TaxID=1399860 RepID=A0A2C5YYU9_9HYPO|nr:hypothetical protein CDD82_4795 [Ophiocordyceps australis]
MWWLSRHQQPAQSSGSPKTPDSVQTSSSSYISSTIKSKPTYKESRLPVRTVPPWVVSYEESLGPPPPDQLDLLKHPSCAHHAPRDLRRRVSNDSLADGADSELAPGVLVKNKFLHFLGTRSRRGRKWDHLRSAETPIVPCYTVRKPAPWGDFIRASKYPNPPGVMSEVTNAQQLKELMPGFDNEPRLKPTDPTRKKAFHSDLPLYQRISNLVLRHWLSPFLFRMIVMTTSILALGIAARIYVIENRSERDSAERTQSLVAVGVDCVAIPFIAWMIWDEYTGKPIGLRSGVSKIRLILLDVFFIIFKSASTGLAFESLVYHNFKAHALLRFSIVLGVFELVGLICWTMNFMINVVRTVERMGGRYDPMADKDREAHETDASLMV